MSATCGWTRPGLEAFDDRFPTVAASLHDAGLDPAVDWLPIAPAAHYLSGGVVTDLDGATALPGLWAVGEVACTGVHGANRLASNSLLEGMVFGARLAEAVTAGRDGPEDSGVMRAVMRGVTDRAGPAVRREIGCEDIDAGAGVDVSETRRAGPDGPADVAKLRECFQRAMIEGAGVLRSPESLAGAAAEVGAVARSLGGAPPATPAEGRDAGDVASLVTVGTALLRAAFAREETRGRATPERLPRDKPAWRRRLVHRRAAPPGTLPTAPGGRP